ncbi:MAG: tetratricopeptide repeat protein [Thermoplasmata archaeon]|nr:tetratricopeptide repeat protein [Thermoplasmata archaeon]MCI4358903.1 tetratricopeptide repeat protein [Thermoplasmata archaeon]
MASSPAATNERGPSEVPIDGARRLFRASEEAEAAQQRDRYLEQLKAYLAFVEERKSDLGPNGAEIAHQLDGTAMAFYRLGQNELASRSIDVGLTFVASQASLLHHKALILLAANREVTQVLPLLEEAVRVDPNDKAIWGTLGDALKLLGRPADATEAYLKAQELDATSTQFVERALRLSPGHPGAQRLCLQLAKAHGGTEQALRACEALLTTSPNDPELLFARVDLLAQLGQIGPALDAVAPARTARPGDPRLAVIAGRLHLASGHTKDALEEFRLAAESSGRLEPAELAELADRIDATGEPTELAVSVRQTLLEREPRNLANLQALRLLAQRTRRFDLGITACQKILEISPGNLEATRALAEFELTSGRTDEGFGTYRTLVRSNPHEAGEIRKAADAARTAGRDEIFREFAQAALDADPGDLATREQLAKSFASAGERDRALLLFEGLIEANPKETRYLWETKKLLSEVGRTADLPKILDHLYEADPTNTRLAYERGAVYLGLARSCAAGSPERQAAARTSVASYERASADAKLAEESLVGLAMAARLGGDHARATQAYEEFLAKPGHAGNATVLKELGQARFDAGRYVEADHAFQQALGLGLEDPDLLWGAAETLSALGLDGRALQLVEILARRDPENVLYQRRRGQLLLRTARLSEGVTILRAAAEKAPGDPLVQFDVADALRAAGAYADAVEFYRLGLEADPASRPARLALAETFNLAGRYNEAVPVVDALLNQDPNDLSAWRIRADACRSLGRTSDLEYSLKATLLLDPTDSSALVEKYRLHLSQGAKAEAFECLSDFLEAGNPDAGDPALLLEAGDLAAELGKTEDANRFYERAQEIDPAQALPIGIRRSRLRLSAGRPDLALEVLEASTRLAPSPPLRAKEVALLRAEILMALERPAEAEAVYRTALAEDPRAIPVLLGLGRALLDQGKHADAKALLSDAIPLGPPVSGLYQLLAEAETGLGSLPSAMEVIHQGVTALPEATELWTRLGEIAIAREDWNEAARAFREAIQRDAANPDLLMRAGFVAERRAQGTEALALYERATQVAPTNKFAWSNRGLALLAGGRPDEATASFDRALALDSDFDAARQGKKAAMERTREAQVARFGREALLLEARLHRSVTRNDLFVTLHVPFDFLEPVLATLSKDPKVDLASLSEEELHALETASCQVITAALERRTDGLERRGFSLADVAALSPTNRSLPEIQRLFGYLRAVLEVELRPENLQLAPDVEELARRALLMPPDQRTLFQLVRNLHVGLFKARLIKVVESSGSAAHAPIASLDFGAFAPDAGPAAPALLPPSEDPDLFPPSTSPHSPHAGTREAPRHAPAPPSAPEAGPARPMAGHARCVGCGGLASIVHTCGAPVCAHCIVEFGTCPKCRQPATLPGPASEAGPPAEPLESSPPAHIVVTHTPSGTLHALRQAVSRTRSPPARAPPPPKPPSEPESKGRSPAAHEPAARPHAPPSKEESAPPPHPTRPKPAADDEPRL